MRQISHPAGCENHSDFNLNAASSFLHFHQPTSVVSGVTVFACCQTVSTVRAALRLCCATLSSWTKSLCVCFLQPSRVRRTPPPLLLPPGQACDRPRGPDPAFPSFPVPLSGTFPLISWPQLHGFILSPSLLPGHHPPFFFFFLLISSIPCLETLTSPSRSIPGRSLQFSGIMLCQSL